MECCDQGGQTGYGTVVHSGGYIGKGKVRVLSLPLPQQVVACLKEPQSWYPPGSKLAMSSAFPMVSPATGSNIATQAVLSREHVDFQVLGFTVCPSFLSVSDSSSECTCGSCTQGEELLSLAEELQEEVGRLRSIRESERRSTGGIMFYHAWNRCISGNNTRNEGFPTLSLPGRRRRPMRQGE